VALADMTPEASRVMKGGHVRTTLKAQNGGRLRAVAWRAEDTPLGRRLLAGGGRLHVAGRLKLNVFSGRRTVEMEIDDAADPRLIDNFVGETGLQ